MKPIDVTWPDIHYTLRFKPDDGGYSADFELFSMVCLPPGEVTYPKKGYVALPSDCTANLNEAQSCATGWIKWDGCTEFQVTEHVDGRSRENVHVCGSDSMAKLTMALTRLYDVAREHIPHWFE